MRALVGRCAEIQTRESVCWDFIKDTRRGIPTLARERETEAGDTGLTRGGGGPKRSCAPHAHGTGAGAWDNKMHRKRREAGYIPAHRTHGTGAGAWDNKMHGKRREAALDPTV